MVHPFDSLNQLMMQVKKQFVPSGIQIVGTSKFGIYLIKVMLCFGRKIPHEGAIPSLIHT